MRRFAGSPRAFETPADVFSFAALAGLLSTLVSAARNARKLLKKADAAMYRPKELGRNAYQFHDPGAAGGEP